MNVQCYTHDDPSSRPLEASLLIQLNLHFVQDEMVHCERRRVSATGCTQ